MEERRGNNIRILYSSEGKLNYDKVTDLCKKGSVQYQEAHRQRTESHCTTAPLPCYVSSLSALHKLPFLSQVSLHSGGQSVFLPRVPFQYE